ncbi:PREDICTED: nicotinamide riboside kinase 1 [Atta cephalotes]|uniref:Phosphoribulokinase/uridine kinase domain-containing protein n=1 Tax=Atta cephalotes TaxID=12957 RepID=A0A158NAJ1_ATTCE|nr:PREDICTED: nicotinamide riboside kinase 1 [Atta cephalotes]
MAKQWFVVGISGATCSGKSTLANKIHDYFPTSVLVCQDNYFLPPGDPRHVKIQELNHVNWELSTSLDMQKMYSDVIKILQSPEKNPIDSKKLLILDGFLLFEHKAITDLCDYKYFLTLTKEQCWKRRKNRIYEPPDVPGYFDKIVWPEFVKYKNEVIQNNELYETVTFIDGSKDMEEICEMVFKKIDQLLS